MKNEQKKRLSATEILAKQDAKLDKMDLKDPDYFEGYRKRNHLAWNVEAEKSRERAKNNRVTAPYNHNVIFYTPNNI